MASVEAEYTRIAACFFMCPSLPLKLEHKSLRHRMKATAGSSMVRISSSTLAIIFSQNSCIRMRSATSAVPAVVRAFLAAGAEEEEDFSALGAAAAVEGALRAPAAMPTAPAMGHAATHTPVSLLG